MAKDPCSELAKKITELAMHIGARPEVKNLDDVVTHMQKLVPQIDRTSLVASINEATTGYAKARDAMGKKLDSLKREARSDTLLRAKIVAMENALRAGDTLPTTVRGTTEPSPSMVALRDRSAELQAAIRQSDAAIKKRYLADIQNLTDRLENGVFTLPEPKAKRPMDRELLNLDYQRFELKKRIRGELEKLKPKTIWGAVSEPFNAARAIKTAFDVSAVMRQGGFIALGNPVRAAKALPDMFRAMKSEKNSYRINKAIFERENAPLYHRDGLFLSEPGTGGLSKQEEVFVSKWAGAIPGVKASERAYVTFLNKIRADTYDALTASLAKNGDVTAEEGAAIANFINIATGRGKLPGSLEKAADALNTIFFAPRYVTSRFQLLTGQPFTGGFKNAAEAAFGKASLPGSAATRKLIAREYAKFVAGVGVVLGLGMMAGGVVEIDPRSADFLKIRFGETRMDPAAGLSQALVLVSRLVSGSTKTSTGEIQPIRGDGARSSGADTIYRFVRSKLAPVPGAIVNALAGEDVVGNPTNIGREVVGLFDPIGRGDIVEALREQGIAKGSLLSAVSLLGVGMNTYGPHAEARRNLSDLEDAGLGKSGVASTLRALSKRYEEAKTNSEAQARIQDLLAKANRRARAAVRDAKKKD